MFKNLDLTRAIAVLMVFASHIIQSGQANPSEFSLIIGRIGVLIFFVHTSYVLMFSLERLSAKYQSFRDLAKSFYIQRIYRVYPLAIVAITALVLIGPPYASETTLKTFIYNILLIQNFLDIWNVNIISVNWSLPPEIEMYLFFPLLFLIAQKSLRSMVAVCLTFFGFAYIATHLDFHIPNIIYNFSYFAPCMLAGIISYAMIQRWKNIRKFSGKYWMPSLLAALLVSGFIFRPYGSRSPVNDWLFCLSLALIIPFFKDWSENLLTRSARLIAKYSFGIYLFHLPMLILIPNLFFSILGTAVLATAAYHFIEEPFVRLGKHRTNQNPAAIPAI